MSKKRVFANEHTIYYSDFIPLKNGIVCLKSIKSQPNSKNAVLNRFISYNQFQTLAGAYYLYAQCNKLPNCYQESIRNLTNSYKSYFKTYTDCSNNRHDECDQQFIYPKGLINTSKKNIYQFPSKLDMEKWCNSKPEICNECVITKKSHCCCPNRCKTGLCKNARNLFI